MPKDKIDPEDPLELNGVVVPTLEDTSRDMAECFAEEFMRMGYGGTQILALFRNPYYLGPHLAFEKHGEPFIRDLIAEVFARWGRPVVGSSHDSGSAPLPPAESGATSEVMHTDPFGAPVPNLNR